jgi:hypothetical protein
MYGKTPKLTLVLGLAVAVSMLVLPAQAQDHRYRTDTYDSQWRTDTARPGVGAEDWRTDTARPGVRTEWRTDDARTYRYDDRTLRTDADRTYRYEDPAYRDAYRDAARRRALGETDPEMYRYRYDGVYRYEPYARYYDDGTIRYEYQARPDEGSLRRELEERDVTRAEERKESFSSNPALRGATDLRARERERERYVYRYDPEYHYYADDRFDTRYYTGDRYYADDRYVRRYDPRPIGRDVDQHTERTESWSHNPAFRSATDDRDVQRRATVWDRDDDARTRVYYYRDTDPARRDLSGTTTRR